MQDAESLSRGILPASMLRESWLIRLCREGGVVGGYLPMSTGGVLHAQLKGSETAVGNKTRPWCAGASATLTKDKKSRSRNF